MNNESYITDTPLPMGQDFNALKQKGLSYIQEYGGTAWTNLNPSDPGITILDQLCYALTELGYCGDFPVADILAQPGNILPLKDQFYLPEEILTSSPVTPEDYRVMLTERVNGVTNAIVTTVAGSGLNQYQVYLSIDPSINITDHPGICKTAFFAVQACRNLCEVFLLPVALAPGAVHTMTENVSLGATTTLPEGSFRDINSYYSIQNTFPEIFAVGADAITSNASQYQIAQSRQLKGYLTLFDQVLANQFSQLANIDKLFSFSNTMSGTPSDEQAFYAVQDKFEKKQGRYPVPFRRFSPTYFYQSLYDLPHIKPLLKGHKTFAFSAEPGPEKVQEQKSWQAYIQDPYNPYIWGLMNCMEDEKTAVSRRNALLDHLLARHGESPLLMDAVTEGAPYCGDPQKDQVIIKSLYLQNLGLLSYFRQKGYNESAAVKIYPVTPLALDPQAEIPADDEIDFIVNTQKIDELEKLGEHDFTNYSALELKLRLLFGLKKIYRDYIFYLQEQKEKNSDKIPVARWMASQRCGLILVESTLLMKYAGFIVRVVLANPVSRAYWQICLYDTTQQVIVSKKLNLSQAKEIEYSFSQNQSLFNTPGIPLQDRIFSIGNSSYFLQMTGDPAPDGRMFRSIPGSDYFLSMALNPDSETTLPVNIPLTDNRIDIIFPDFRPLYIIVGKRVPGPILPFQVSKPLPELIPQINTAGFRDRLELFLQSNLPVHLPYTCHYIYYPLLEPLILAFVKWHNALCGEDPGQADDANRRACADAFIVQLIIAGVYPALKSQAYD